MKPVLLDSSGWIEYLADGPLAAAVSPFLKEPESVLVPSIVLYEVYKKLKSAKGEETATVVAAQMSRCVAVPFDETLALAAADLGLAHGLALADAVVLATARAAGAELVTLDRDFKGLPGAKILG